MAIAIRQTVILGALALAVAGAAVPASAASAHQVSAAASAFAPVPWKSAGPGWAVAEYSLSAAGQGEPKTGATTLYLTGPKGQKYPFYRWPASQTMPFLVDWSGDRQRVLAETSFARNQFVQVSLVTGKVVSRFTLPPTVFPLGYTRPDGLNLLALRQQGTSTQILRYDLAGHLQIVLASGKDLVGSAIDSADGTSVVVGTTTGLELVSNDTGKQIRRLSVPLRVTDCEPVRWWSATTILASCNAAETNNYSRLWLFPAGGGTVTALTPQRSTRGPDFGDVAAWKLPGGLFVQAQGPAECSTMIARQPSAGPERFVAVPGYGSAEIETAVGSRLLVRVYDVCFTSASLAWFNLVTRSLSFVIHAPVKISGVRAVIPFGRPTSS